MSGNHDQLAQLTGETFVRTVEHFVELGSTSDRAIELAPRVDLALPLLVLADRQIAGRGRGANRWWAGGGALTFSLLVESESFGLPPHRWPQVSLATALAVAETLVTLVPAERVRLKWPNDVFVDDRKICGILVESPAAATGRLVIGLGLNVNNSAAAAPAELRAAAMALCDVVGREVPLGDVLLPLLKCIEAELGLLADSEPALASRWRTYCLLEGRTVCLKDQRETSVGVCHGIDSDGALLLATERGVRRFLSGTIVEYR